MVTEEQIQSRPQSKRGALQLPQMREHQDWVKMHADLRISEGSSGPMTAFLNMVRGLLPKDKYQVFQSLLRPPYPSTEVTSVVFDRLSRVFEGRNPVFNYQFKKKDDTDDWEWYRQEVLGEPSVWRNKGWEYFRTEPNSVIVVDMPLKGEEDPTDGRPQPYFYWVTVDRIIDFETDDDGNIVWIAYRDEDKQKVYLVDDETYRVYDFSDGGFNDTSWITGEPTVMVEHNLGFCPATFFVETPVSLSQPNVKRSPITAALAQLDWYLFFATSKKHLDTYGAYPIYTTVEQECTYEEELEIGETKQFVHCDHGVLVDDSGRPVMGADGKAKSCPRCGGHPLTGPGTLLTRPMPNTNDGVPDIKNTVQVVGIDKGSLDYNAEECDRLRKDIISQCVGVEADGISQFGASDKQIDASFESASTILIRTEKEIEHAQMFVDKCCCLLRYGDGFESLDISYGTEFYASSSAQARKLYDQARESGAPEADLMALREQVMEAEYRNNDLQKQRLILLGEVEPLVGMKRDEVMDALEKGLVSADDVKIKLNFESLIRRFERENGSIINFGLDGSANETERQKFAKRVETIKQILKEYVREFKS